MNEPTGGSRRRRRPKQQRSRATVDAIVEAARRSLGRYGALRTTAEQIARIAGVSIGTFYQYFPDKISVYSDLLDHLSGRLHRQLESVSAPATTAEGALSAIVSAYLGALRDNVAAAQQLLGQRHLLEPPERLQARHKQLHTWLVGLFDQHLPNDAPQNDLPAFVLLKAVHGVAHGATLEKPETLADGSLEHELLALVRGYLAERKKQ
ncbi:MAG: TetR/AcrR family transcriptional regulator [Deltaproteobacteria bacterium]|nr:TetR/AcrR family transcriptional regulator [Deltaproteobacteria bacterium]